MSELTFTIKLDVAPEDEDSKLTKDRLTDLALVAIGDAVESIFPASTGDGEGNEVSFQLLDWSFE
jgi:hypothetical protein